MEPFPAEEGPVRVQGELAAVAGVVDRGREDPLVWFALLEGDGLYHDRLIRSGFHFVFLLSLISGDAAVLGPAFSALTYIALSGGYIKSLRR